jgi:citronellyl-CoA synthetase
MLKNISSTLDVIPVMASIAREAKPRPADTADCFAARVQQTAERFGDNTAVTFEGQSLTWEQLNQAANRCARACLARGLQHGDCASLLMENRIEYLVAVVALNKIGVTAALINTNLSGRSLAHCIEITGSKACLFGEERLGELSDVRAVVPSVETYLFVADSGEQECPSWAYNLDEEAADEESSNLQETADVTLGDKALYVFTSGTTGLPKAAIMTNKRFLITSSLAAKGGLRCDENDCIYLCLPLYHGTALFIGAGSAFNSGAEIFLRRRFSASAFLPEVREHGATCFIYIGEICRYLLSLPENKDDYANPLGTIMGNGLRPDIWHQFKERFGIKRVSEFYGSSEGNLGMVNLFNRDCTVGTTPIPHVLVQYDVDNDEIIRDKRGFCIRAAPGTPGLLLGKITKTTQFEGYTNKEATESKILRDVLKKGDAYFNTGDLLRTIDVGFALGLPHYQFVDRVGDTFRWKGENVSTNEVGEVINCHPQVYFSNVYGVEVPGTDGRAGMAALLLAENVDELELDNFSSQICKQLPAYARPLFLRILPAMDTTGTFKMVKGELRKQGFDPEQVEDRLYVMKPGTERYQALSREFAAQILAGNGGY